MGLDAYELYLQLEDDFGVRLLESTLLPAEYVGELFDVVLQTIREQHPERFDGSGHYEDEAWEQYRTILSENLGVERELVVRSSHFVLDLKLD